MARRTFTLIASWSVNAFTSTTKTRDTLTFVDVCNNSSSEHSQIKILNLIKERINITLTHTHTHIHTQL
jgi:hypothetical protein